MIRVEHFSKQYEDAFAVRDLSFEVEPGQILGLVGPNGAGKTTTLRALAGILPPSDGTLEVAGYDIVGSPIEAKRRLAFVPDVPHLFDHLSVWEHLAFTARIYGVSAWEEPAQKLLERFEIAGHADKMADELSLGMSQKVVMCCAMLHAPTVVLLDEPLTGLDPRGIRTLYDALRALAEDGASIVLSTHLLGQIEDLCDRFLILAGGERVVYGSRDDLQRSLTRLEADASLEEIFFEATEGGGVHSGGRAEERR